MDVDGILMQYSVILEDHEYIVFAKTILYDGARKKWGLY